MKKHGRIMWIDLVRIFAIFLVVLLHNSRLPSEITLLTLPSFIVLAVAKTSVPLFVMVSGALLLGKVESYRVFFKKEHLEFYCPGYFGHASSSLLRRAALYLP